jgi:hypothetical protein
MGHAQSQTLHIYLSRLGVFDRTFVRTRFLRSLHSSRHPAISLALKETFIRTRCVNDSRNFQLLGINLGRAGILLERVDALFAFFL